MPANLTPDYLAAERRFREAETPEQRLAALQDMLATIPKHKGTEKMQGDIKRRIARLKQASERRSGGARQKTFWHVDREGAGQIVLLGPPNSGKSALLAALTNAAPEVADYPFTTRVPLPGMVLFENVQVQLLDLPPLAPGRSPPWLKTVVRNADGVLVVFDLASDDLLEQAEDTIAELEECGLLFGAAGPDIPAGAHAGGEGDRGAQRDDPTRSEEAGTGRLSSGEATGLEGFGVPTGSGAPDALAAAPGVALPRQPALIAGAKADDPDAAARLSLLREVLAGSQLAILPLLPVSATRGTGLAELRRALFGLLGKVRVYTKAPGKKPDLTAPFVVPRGSTVVDVAEQVHKDFARDLKYARVWGRRVFEGQTVQREYVVEDGDILELHV